jgi:hypothetical protein
MELSNSASGRLYDRLESELRSSDLYYIDNEYLLGELTSWGKKLVYTDDYKAGVDSVVNEWNCLAKAQYNNDSSTLQAISDSENAISKVNNSDNKAYLTEQLQQVKDRLANKPNYVAPTENNEGLVQTSTGKWLKYEEELTKKANVDRIVHYEKSNKYAKTDALLQSAINISQGKDVDSQIKKENKWFSHEWDKGHEYLYSYYKCHTDNIVVSEQAPKYVYIDDLIRPNMSGSASDFDCVIIYYDQDSNTYESHNIWIVL